MLHTKPQGHWPLILEKKIYEGFFTMCGRGGHLGQVTQTPQKTSVPPSHWGYVWNLALIGQAVLEKKIFVNGGRTTDNGRTTEHAYTTSSPMSPKGSSELKIAKTQSSVHNELYLYKTVLRWSLGKLLILPPTLAFMPIGI